MNVTQKNPLDKSKRAVRAALANALALSSSAATKAANAAAVASRATELAVNVVADRADKAVLVAAAATLKAARMAVVSAKDATTAATNAAAAATSTINAATTTAQATKATKAATKRATRAAVSPDAVAATKVADEAALEAAEHATETKAASNIAEATAIGSADSIASFVKTASEAVSVAHDISVNNAAKVAVATAAAAAAAADAAASAATAAADVTAAAVTAANIISANGEYNRALIESSLDPFVTIDSEGNIGDVNKAMEKVTGYSRGKLIGTGVFAYVTEPDLARKDLHEVLEKGSIRNFPLTIKHKSGRTTDVLYNASLYRDKAGVVQGVLAAARDITEQKRNDDRIRHLASFPRLNATPILEFSTDGELIYANPAARSASKKLHVKELKEWLPQDWQTLVSGPEGKRRISADEMHGERTFFKDLRFIHEFNALRLYVADITERARASDALQSSEARLRQVIDLMPQLVYVRDWDEKLLMCNKAFTDFYGYASEAPVCSCGSSIEDDRMVMLEGTPITLSEVLLDRAGRRHDMGTTKVPYQYIGDEGQQTYAVLGVSQDLTEVMRYEKAQVENLKKIKTILAGTVSTITAISSMRDPYTAGHETRVADLSVAIATELGRSPEEVEELRIIAKLHDLGKIYVPSEILNRPGRLTEVEFGLVKTHARVGYDIMKEAALPLHIANTILQHHERMDGSGYPLGIKGDKINMDARILAVADVVEAMNSHRPYRASLGIDAALEEIEKNKRKLYDARVVDTCVTLFRDRIFEFH